MRENHSFRRAGGPRGVENRRRVVSAAARDFRIEECGIAAVELAPDRLQVHIARQLGLRVMPQATRIPKVNVRELGALRQDLQELVDLLLILHHRVRDLGVLEDKRHLFGDCILVERNGNTAQALRGGNRPVKPRPILADDGEVHAAPEALLYKPARKRAHFRRDLRPGPSLPNAKILFANGRTFTADLRVMDQQPRERVETLAIARHSHPLLLKSPIRNG